MDQTFCYRGFQTGRSLILYHHIALNILDVFALVIFLFIEYFQTFVNFCVKLFLESYLEAKMPSKNWTKRWSWRNSSRRTLRWRHCFHDGNYTLFLICIIIAQNSFLLVKFHAPTFSCVTDPKLLHYDGKFIVIATIFYWDIEITWGLWRFLFTWKYIIPSCPPSRSFARSSANQLFSW